MFTKGGPCDGPVSNVCVCVPVVMVRQVVLRHWKGVVRGHRGHRGHGGSRGTCEGWGVTSSKACILHMHHRMGRGPTSLDILLLPARRRDQGYCMHITLPVETWLRHYIAGTKDGYINITTIARRNCTEGPLHSTTGGGQLFTVHRGSAFTTLATYNRNLRTRLSIMYKMHSLSGVLSSSTNTMSRWSLLS